MKFNISKDFEISYGHRVWSQTLNNNFTEDTSCKCKFLHGHNAKITVSLTSLNLNNGMVTDFKHLTWVKALLDLNLDHKFIIDEHDPLFNNLIGGATLKEIKFNDLVIGKVVDVEKEGGPQEYKELMGSYFIVSFVPTSENMSYWLAKIIEAKMQILGIHVDNVAWWETPKSRSVVYL